MELQAEVRESGKSVNTLREKGLIPAELYGHGVDNQHLAIQKSEFRKIFKEAGESTVISLKVGGKKQAVLIHDVQEDGITGEVMHIDFLGVRMDEVISANVAIEFEGVAPAVKEQGGILNKTLSEIEVEALPADLPKNIVVDISPLTELNQSIYVKDLQLPKGVTIKVDPETVVVSVSPPLAEEEAPVVNVADVKVEGEEEKAKRDAEKDADNSK